MPVLAVIAPADAFRLLLGAGYGKVHLKVADKITSASWFRKSHRIPVSVQTAAHTALAQLRARVAAGEIRLRGELRTERPPADIDPADCARGELDVFGQTLAIYTQKRDRDPARIYRRVFCVKADVKKIVDATRNSVEPELKKAAVATIREEISAVYDAADKGGPRPNINQLAGAVQPRLQERGYKVSLNQIKIIGGEPQFAKRRRRRGRQRIK
jgi:hypothetical protein